MTRSDRKGIVLAHATVPSVIRARPFRAALRLLKRTSYGLQSQSLRRSCRSRHSDSSYLIDARRWARASGGGLRFQHWPGDSASPERPVWLSCVQLIVVRPERLHDPLRR